jgi:chromosomal replication initiation ATPase DnaA
MVSTAFATAPSPPRSDPQATDPNLVWQRVLSLLKLNTGEAHFDTYLRGTRGLAYDPGASVIRVAAANPFHVPWLEGKLSSTIHTAVAEIVGARCASSSSLTRLPHPTVISNAGSDRHPSWRPWRRHPRRLTIRLTVHGKSSSTRPHRARAA